MNTMIFTKEKYKALKAEYEKYKHKPDDVFAFEGHHFLVSYAKYVLMYLEMQGINQ